VTVVKDGKDTAAQVTLGVAGASLTEVRSGVRVGDRVVLADYSTPVPASTNTTTGNGSRLARLLEGGGGSLPAILGGR
jgi:hypothetical protein